MKIAVPAFLAFAFALSAESACAAPAVPLSANKEETMETQFRRVPYKELNARQKESHNFHKVAAALANYGYNAIRLSDDWEGADFIAVHIDGETMLRVQLKSVLTVAKKYSGKGLHIAFPDGDAAYVFPHDEFVKSAGQLGKITHTPSWKEKGLYRIDPTPEWARKLLSPYRILF